MQIDLVHRNVRVTLEQKEWVQRRMHFALGRFSGRIRCVTLVFSDINGCRGGVDKKCRVVVVLSPQGEIVLEEIATNIEAAVATIADRVARAISRTLDRQFNFHAARDLTTKAGFGATVL
ncbi:MAG: HPF/RaiA family ribosome-associated protein [Planctomycetaceae bacterium]